MRIAFITSMDRGIPLFILNELNYYFSHGIEGKVFFVMSRPGVYMPPEHWHSVYLSPFNAFVHQITYLFKNPKKYIELLFDALKHRTLFEFFIAWEFAQHMHDCTHIHAFFADHKLVIARYCAAILQKTFSCSVYGYDVYCPKNRELIKEIYKHTEFVVATNLLFKELLNRNFGVPQEKIILARTVVDASKYSNSIEYTPEDRKVAEAVATQRNAFKILCVARLVYRKGVHILIHAISMLVRKKRNVVLWIVGDGVERRNLEKLAEKLGISQHVQFFGALGVENLLPLYQNCDLYCQPSITDPGGDKEGLPVAMTEAMAFEKVVIATRHADIPNVIREILVPENNAEALADAIERVIEMPEQMRKAIGVKNREIVLQEFSEKNYDRVIARFLSL